MAVLKDLIVHGPSRFVNGAQFNTINAESIGASEGIFNKLIATTLDAKEATIDDLTATNATIVGLLDVQGQMQTNSWTNSNIATIDGSFYICPTISSEATITTSGTTQTSNNKFLYNGSTIVLTGSWATTGSLYLNTTAANWNLYSKVMITGEVLIGNEWTPIGTIRGVLQGINTSGGTITIGSLSSNITVGSDGTINSLPAILSLVTSGTTYNARKLKVSLYEYNSAGTSSGATNLIGIMMTTAGTHNLTYIDIYNGLNSKTSYTSTIDNTTKATEPMVRIGNLNGLPNIVDGSTSADTQPSGWGIYTTNGFFKGKIVSNAGKIGDFTISSALYSGTHSAYNTATTGIYIGDTYLSGGSGAVWYLKSDGSAKIGAMTLSSAGVLTLGSISLNASGTATIGPWTVNSTSIYKGNATQGTAGTGNMYFGNDGLSISNTFTVSNAGVLNATGAILKSVILQDSSGNTKAIVDGNGLTIYDGSGTAAANKTAIFGSTATIGYTSGNKYNVYIDSNGINLRYNTTVLNLIDTSGMTVKNSSGITLAEFKSYINIGTSNNNSKAGTAVIGTGLEISSQLDATNQTQTIVGKYNLQDPYANFLVGIGTSASNRINAFGVSSTYGQQILEMFEGNGSNTQMTTTFNVDTTKSITAYQVDNSSVTYTATASSSNTKQITFTTAPTNGTRVCVYYTTTDNNGYIYTSKNNITARGAYSFSQGEGEALGYASQAFGKRGDTTTSCAIQAMGIGTLAHGYASDTGSIVAQGEGTYAGGSASVASSLIQAVTSGSFAHGYVRGQGKIKTTGLGALACGDVVSGTMAASGQGAIILGHINNGTMTASGSGSVILGEAVSYGNQIASGSGSLIGGMCTGYIDNSATMTSSGTGSIIFGYNTRGSTMTASESGSVALNESTHALKRAQLAIGSFNADDSATTTTHPSSTAAYGTYAFIIGNGTGESARSNALTVDWQGNLNAAGSISSKTEAYTPTLPSTFTATAVQVFRKSGVVSINIVNIIKSPAGSLTLFTLPEGWRPPDLFAFLVGIPNGDPKYRLSINASGSVAIYNYGAATTASTNVTGTCTFVTA